MKPRTSALLVVLLYCLLAYLLHGFPYDLTTALLGGGDGYSAGLPSKVFSATLSPWNPYVQLGQYAYANTQYQPFYPIGLLAMSLLPPTLGYNVFILLHYVLAGWFFYLFARGLRLSVFAAFLGGLMFLGSGFLLAHKGHQAMLAAAIWLPLMLYSCDLYASTRRLRHAAWGGVAMALSALAGFPQITVYSLLVVLPYFLYRTLRARVSVRGTVIGLVLFGSLALLLSSLQLVSVAEALPYVTRERISASMFSEDALPVQHLLALLVPNLLGGFYGVPTYSTNLNSVEVYPYAGLLTLTLAVFAWLSRRVQPTSPPELWFWTTVAVASAILCLGLPFLQAVLYRVPVYNLFRAPSRHLFELDFALAVLASYGVHALQLASASRDRGLSRRSLYAGSIIALVVTAALLLAHLSRTALAAPSRLAQLPALVLGRAASTNADAVIKNLSWTAPTMLQPLLVTLAILILLVALRYIPQRLLRVALPLLFVADVGSIYVTLYPNLDTRDLYPGPRQRPEVTFLKQNLQFDATHYRIFTVEPSAVYTYPLLNMMYGLSAVNDYTPMWLKRYQSLTGFPLNGAAPPSLLSRQRLLSAFSAQYLLAADADTVALVRHVVSRMPTPSPLPVPPMNCAALGCTLATFPTSDQSRLQSPDGSAVSMIQFPLSLQPSTNYRVNFEARAVGTQQLSVDLHAEASGAPVYNRSGQRSNVDLTSTAFVPQEIIINSGERCPSSAQLRLYTRSTKPLDVRHIAISALALSPAHAYVEVAHTAQGLVIWKNPGAAPRFRFATDLLPSRDTADVNAALQSDATLDVTQQAFVEGLSARESVAPGRILSEQITNSRLRWQVETGTRSFFIVGDSWFPGWTATVDGRPSPIHIVNGCTRGLFVEGAGLHNVEMRFWPRSLTIGLWATALGLAVLGLLTRVQRA